MLPIVVSLTLVGVQPQVGRPAAADPPATERSAAGAFLPDTTVTPPGGARVVRLPAAGHAVAALRVHVPLEERAAEAGVGHVLRALALERTAGPARRIGARVRGVRTASGLSYTVEGPVEDFEYLAYLARLAVAAPEIRGPVFQDALQELQRSVAREGETPAGRIARELREAVAPDAPPTSGTPATADDLGPTEVLDAWSRSHVAERMTVVVAADVPLAVVLAATRDLGTSYPGRGGPATALTPPATAGPRTQTLRTWYGVAWAGGNAGDPAAPVVALLLADHLDRMADGFEAGVQLWELPDRWVIAAMGAAYSRRRSRMRQSVAGALATLTAGITPGDVRRAVGLVIHDLHVRARTPGGLVDVVGRAMEVDDDPTAAARYRRALDGLGPAEVEAFVERLLEATPAEAEVRAP